MVNPPTFAPFLPHLGAGAEGGRPRAVLAMLFLYIDPLKNHRFFENLKFIFSSTFNIYHDMKQTSNTAVLRPSLAAVALQVLRLVVLNLLVIYRAIAKKKPLLRLYRLQLRAAYKAAAWMDRHPVITGVVCYGLVAILTLQMFVGFMDAWCGIE